MGQAAYFSRHHDVEQEYHFGFYVSVPGRKYTLFFMSEVSLYNTYKYTLEFSKYLSNINEFPIQRKIENKMKEKICKYLKKRKKDK